MQRQTHIEHSEVGQHQPPRLTNATTTDEGAAVMAIPSNDVTHETAVTDMLTDESAGTAQQTETARQKVDRNLAQFASLVRTRHKLHLMLKFFGLGVFLSVFVLGPINNRMRTQDTGLLQKELAAQRKYVEAIQAQVAHPDIMKYMDKAGRVEAERNHALEDYKRATEEWSRSNAAANQRAEQMNAVESRFRLERTHLEEKFAPYEALEMLLGLLSFAGVAGVAFTGVGVEWKQRRLARSLAETNDPRAIGPLVEALAPGEPPQQTWAQQALGSFALAGIFTTSPIVFQQKQRDIIVAALSQLLPGLQAEEARLLTEKQRTSLVNACFLANVDKEADLIIAAMQMFVKIEDSRMLLIVQMLSELEGDSEAKARVKAVAIASLPALKECAEREQQSSTLLSAANDVAPTDPAVLLRSTSTVTGDFSRP